MKLFKSEKDQFSEKNIFNHRKKHSNSNILIFAAFGGNQFNN